MTRILILWALTHPYNLEVVFVKIKDNLNYRKCVLQQKPEC